MKFNIKATDTKEKGYTYAQSEEVRKQIGSIGHLRGDFDSNGLGFFTRWENHCEDLLTAEFRDELDEVINSLRSDDCGLLKDRSSMRAFVRKHPDSVMEDGYTPQYGFRIDTEKHSYLLRCNPTKGDYNFYCFCYRKENLNKYLENGGK